MQIANNDFLNDIGGREDCPGCGHSRKFYCSKCVKPMPCVQGRLPDVELPLQCHILKDMRELVGKSTASHAGILASTSATVFEYPDIPDYRLNLDETVIGCVSPSASTLEELDADCIKKLKTVVFIDGTWTQVGRVLQDERLSGLRHVILRSRRTQFWRPNGRRRPDTYLATIEAVYYFFVDYHTSALGLRYAGQYDNLLFFFDYFLRLIKGNGFEMLG